MKRFSSSAESTTLRRNFGYFFIFIFFVRPDTVHRMSESRRRRAVIYTAGREQQTHGGRARKNKMPPQSNSISYALSANAPTYNISLSNCIHFVRRRRRILYILLLYLHPPWPLRTSRPPFVQKSHVKTRTVSRIVSYRIAATYIVL